jgi:hypothetical protein
MLQSRVSWAVQQRKNGCVTHGGTGRNGAVDLLTFIGWTLLVFVAYKLGMYVDQKMQEKRRAMQAQADAETDPEQKR